jgi:hypothetical protein
MQATRADLRWLLLTQQGLLGERCPGGGAAGAVAWVRRHGFLMLEPEARAFAPGHDLVLFNRISGYQAGDVESALYGGRRLIEHYLHVLGALPAEDYPLIYDPERAARASQPGSMGAWVLACLAAEGPCTLRELHTHLGQNHDARRALGEAVRELYGAGAILVREREGSQPVYGLAQAVLGGEVPAPAPLEERLHALTRRSLQVLAPVTRSTWSQVLNSIGTRAGLGLAALKREKSRLMAGMLASGEAVLLEGNDLTQGYIVPADWPLPKGRPPHVAPRVFFLSPLDPVVWDGQRARDLFGFDVRQQAFRPTLRERRFVAPTLPILFGQALVGRLEVQIHWAEERLLVHAVHLENQPELSGAQFRAAFADALHELANWLGVREIRAVGPVPPRLLSQP